jgi:hypothetical protein
MRTFSALIFIVIFSSFSYSQNDINIFDLFTTQLDNNILRVYNLDSTLIFQKKFNNASDQAADLDGDGVNEYLVTDSYQKDRVSSFTIYIFNTIDTFYLADSIFSGLIEPYLNGPGDSGTILIITGNPKFDSLNTNLDEPYLPVNCWKYEDEKINLVNDQVYDIFISENNDIIDYLDDFYDRNSKSCEATEKVRAAISSVYVNYLSAGETIMAKQFINKYYFCNDRENFISHIEGLIK